MKRNGYQTGMVGKWHLPANPAKTGFDYFVYKKGAGGPYYNPNGYLQNPSLGSDVIEERSYPGYITRQRDRSSHQRDGAIQRTLPDDGSIL